MTHYPHHALVLAWLDGQTIQYQTATDLWADMPSVTEADKLPHFYRNEVYRLKPRVLRCRIAATRNGAVLADGMLAEAATRKRTDFVRWLTDWQEFTL